MSRAPLLFSPIRMAAPKTTWRAQKSVWQLSKPLGRPKNPYGGSANHLASPKIRQTTHAENSWITKKYPYISPRERRGRPGLAA